MSDEKWDRRFLELAKHISTWSKDPSTKVGAVLVASNNIVVGLGYNGIPRGVVDTNERLNDRETKYQFVVHAEANAILMAGDKAKGATLYVYPSFVLPPICNECAKLVVQPTTSHAQQKQLLRFLIKDVTLTSLKSSIDIQIRWQTEAITTRQVARRPKSCDIRRTPSAVVDRIRTLAANQTDAQIATTLNQEGLTPGLGGTFTPSKVQWIRYAYQIASACPLAPGACPAGQRGDGRYSTHAAADLLNVNVSTIATWCETGVLDSIQEAPHGLRWIQLSPDIIATLRKPIRQRWQKTRSKMNNM